MSRLSKSRIGTAKSARRREELRRTLPRPTFDFKAVLQKPELVNAALILIAFVVLASWVVSWSRDQPKVRDGQIMNVTAIKRLTYDVIDEEATLAQREDARSAAPRIYRLNDAYLNLLDTALAGLPTVVAGKILLDEIKEEVRREFDLEEAELRALQSVVVDGEASQEWLRWVNRLVRNDQLIRNPLLRSDEFQTYTLTNNRELIVAPDKPRLALKNSAIELPESDGAAASALEERLQDLINNAGFPPQLRSVVLARLRYVPQPTIQVDEEATRRAAEAAANSVPDVRVQHREGDILYKRGDVLKAEQYSEVLNENERYLRGASTWERWQHRLGVVGLIAIVTLFLGSFALIAYPRIVRNPLRLAAICVLMGGMLTVAAVITSYAPIFLYPAAIGPTLFVAIILLVAYDQRLALLLSGVQCMIVTLALEQSIGFFILLIAGCATAIVQLREVRHRNSLIRAATGTAAVLGVGTLVLALLEVPISNLPANAPIQQQILIMALSAIFTCYGVSFLILGILPSIERLFDITTGMTLAELRDPKRPLLRQLQQRAPGTYNHSLQVANIAEAAAEAIEADGLLVYVGALYHDIGKINKPEYFVENQGGGFNRHEKLSPAMSLLVIIGHVKNGIELAREYSLPRQIQHFIESHHGTTLVEYFYHAAKSRGEATDQPVAEVEYRYPGPKPHTKEAAILMLSDAVESATRAMAEPNPSRIETLVRKLSAKRLEDGQFDQCDLTFRELALIEDAIINRLMAIYHSRISYPSSGTRLAEETEAPRAKPASA